ncbi:MAG: long-chain acyl-CoA synthetase, partial [Pseudonocardiales bacterium]|nr:long-chain acyl-CoA synthetase [Pseudonocardiales bacterium]
MPASRDQAGSVVSLTSVTSFDELLRRHASAAPDEVAVRERHLGLWRDLSWSWLRDAVDRVADRLRAEGVTPGAAVVLIGRPSPQWLVGELAALQVGAAVHTVADRPVRGAIQRVRAVPELRAVLVAHADARRSDAMAGEVGGALAEHSITVPIVSVRSAATDDAASPGRDPGQPATPGTVVVPTAGTSGEYRWIALDEAIVIERWGTLLDRFTVRHSDRVVVGGSLDYWANRLALLTSCLVRCAVLHFNDDGVADQATRAQVRPTVLWSTSRDWSSLAGLIGADLLVAAGWIVRLGFRRLGGRHGPRPAGRVLDVILVRPMLRQLGLSRVRAAWAFGDRMPDRTVAAWSSWGIPLSECYARAEHGGVVAARLVTGGRPAPDFTFLDGDAPGPGDLLAAGPLSPADATVTRADGAVAIVSDTTHAAAADDGRRALFESALRESPYVSEALVFDADGESVLVLEPNIPGLLPWARAAGLRFTSVDRLVTLPEVRELVTGLIDAAARPGVAAPTRVIVVPDLAAVRGGTLVSCSGRPRRQVIAET